MPKRRRTREQPGGEQRNVEQEVETDRSADELRQIRRHRDRLGLQTDDAGEAGTRARQTSGRFIPVAMPSLALIDWISIAMRFAISTTQRSRYPNFAPAATLVAKLPGST